MSIQNGRLVSGGRLQIPADVRRELGLKDGDTVSMVLEDGVLKVRPFSDVLREVRAMFRDHKPPVGESHVDDFIAQRRREAELD